MRARSSGASGGWRRPMCSRWLDRWPAGQPAVVVSNHASYADAVVLAAALPADVRRAAKSELAHAGVVGFVLRRLGTHFVARDDSLRGIEDTRSLVAAVRAGGVVGSFPEGTFTRAPGIGPFRLGAFAVAVPTGVPDVPVVLEGTRSLLRAGRRLPERHPMRASVGAPVVPDGTDWSAAVRLRDAVRGAVVAASGEPDLAR